MSSHVAHQPGGAPSASVDEESVKKSARRRTAWLVAGDILTLVALVIVGLYQDAPPLVKPTTAPVNEFSAERALIHLPAIAGEIHPVGSAENAAVRQYLVDQLTAMGLETHVQKAEALRRSPGRPAYEAGTVYNVVGRLPGTVPGGKAVVLMAHYDSVVTGYGAGDTGIGVAAILEAVRALQSDVPLQNDLIVLFTDSEEYGLLGAQAYVDEDPWAAQTGVVINLEGQGPAGPVYIFETTPHNGLLIQELAEAVPFPLMSSLSMVIYQLLPHANDLVHFRAHEYAGITTAILSEKAFYHSVLDRLELVDVGTVQHQGSYALSMARHFGRIALPLSTTEDAVFFTAARSKLVYYGENWALPIALTAALLFAVILWAGVARRRMTWRGVAVGLGALLLSLILASAVAWLVVNRLGLSAASYRHTLFTIGFVALAVSLTLVVMLALRPWSLLAERTSGILSGWSVLALISAFLLPEASYLFVWPLVAFLPFLAYLVFGHPQHRPGRVLLLAATCAAPPILFLIPLTHAIFLALTVEMPLPGVMLTVLMLSLLLPLFDYLMQWWRWTLPLLGLVLAAGMIGWGARAGYDAAHPQRYDLSYSRNADSGESGYISMVFFDHDWFDQFFAESGEMIPAQRHKLFYSGSSRLLYAPGPELPLAAPSAELVADEIESDRRRLTVHVYSPRQAPYLLLQAANETTVLSAKLNGEPFPIDDTTTVPDSWGLRYYGLPAGGIDLTFEIPANEVLSLRIIDQTPGLPKELNTPPPPDSFMPANYGIDLNSTYVSQTYSF